MEKLIAAPPAGAIVEARGARWRLVERRAFERCALVTLHGHDRHNLGETLRLLTPFDRLLLSSRTSRLRLAGGRAVARHVADAIVRAHPWHGCWTAATATIDLLSWQLEPALAVLAGATRVLLADEVGLGKTVQAGLILAELQARGLIERTLILTPAGLRAQWADELAARFAISASVLDQAALAREAAQLPPGANPWSSAAVVISSIDLAKRAGTSTAVDRVPFDLLIVDEAHHLTPASDRGALIARLAQRTPWVILISATPHSGDPRAFAFLRDIGGTSADRLTIFRRGAPPRAQPARRRLVRVSASADERALLDEIRQYSRAIWSARSATSGAARLVAIVLARRAASSADAVLASLVRRQHLLRDSSGTGAEGPEGRAVLALSEVEGSSDQFSFPWEETDAQDGDEADSVLSAPGLSDVDEERGRLGRLIALAQRARASASKPAWIARFLARAREPLIVFSEYRDTVEALRARFESIVPTAVLHGGLSPSARRVATASFVDGHARLLLATDAGGEGLNLQARCRAVVDVELPWNPLRLAQRVGRVDRIGQRRRVHAMRLFHAGSVEETVLAHLYRRQANVDAGLGSLDIDTPGSRDRNIDLEARVAAAVLGDSPSSLTMPNWPCESAPGAEAETGRLQGLRQLVEHTRVDLSRRDAIRPGDDNRVPVSVPRRPVAATATSLSSQGRSDASASATCVFEVASMDHAHRLVGAVVVPVDVTLSRPLPRVRRERLRLLRAISAQVARSEAVEAIVTDRFRRDRAARHGFDVAVRARIEALVDMLTARSDRWQPALFDDRSTRAASERASVLEVHRVRFEHLKSTLARAPESTDESTIAAAAESPRLIGVWLHD